MLATLAVGAIAVQTAPSGTPLQHGSADRVTVEVYRSGAVVFHFDPASLLYRQLEGKQLGVSCLTFDSVSPWEPEEVGSSTRTLAETMQMIFSEATQHQLPYATLDPESVVKPPFDGCLVNGSYGRHWNDPRGQHSPAEIGFTATGRRFFDERAVCTRPRPLRPLTQARRRPTQPQTRRHRASRHNPQARAARPRRHARETRPAARNRRDRRLDKPARHNRGISTHARRETPLHRDP